MCWLCGGPVPPHWLENSFDWDQSPWEVAEPPPPSLVDFLPRIKVEEGPGGGALVTGCQAAWSPEEEWAWGGSGQEAQDLVGGGQTFFRPFRVPGHKVRVPAVSPSGVC